MLVVVVVDATLPFGWTEGWCPGDPATSWWLERVVGVELLEWKGYRRIAPTTAVVAMWFEVGRSAVGFFTYFR